MGCTGSTVVTIIEEGRQERFQDAYTLGRKLGEGAFGQVCAAEPKFGGGAVAVKIIDVRGYHADGEPTGRADIERASAARREVAVWEAVGANAHCVRLQGSFADRTYFYMVMEKCDCSLLDKLAISSSMTEVYLAGILRGMLLGIEHVHSVDVVHRDIKPDNFLLSGVGGSVVKLCDFGLAIKKPARGLLTGVCGTAPYMSPEMLGDAGHGKLTDVWSFGATAYLMVHRDFPYLPAEMTAAAVKRAIREDRPRIKFVRPRDEELFFSRACMDCATPFLQALLQRAPATRPSASEALQLPFLSLDKRSAKELASSAAELPLVPAVLKARKATPELNKTNHVVQRRLDQLPRKLQDQFVAPAASSAPCFSETAGDERIRRRSETWHGTHSGVVYLLTTRRSPKANLNKGLHGLGAAAYLHDDAASTASPGSRGDSILSAGSSPSFGVVRRPRTSTASEHA